MVVVLMVEVGLGEVVAVVKVEMVVVRGGVMAFVARCGGINHHQHNQSLSENFLHLMSDFTTTLYEHQNP